MKLRSPLRSWRKRRACLHHSKSTGQTWIEDILIDTGLRKLRWCTACGRTWIV